MYRGCWATCCPVACFAVSVATAGWTTMRREPWTGRSPAGRFWRGSDVSSPCWMRLFCQRVCGAQGAGGGEGQRGCQSGSPLGASSSREPLKVPGGSTSQPRTPKPPGGRGRNRPIQASEGGARGALGPVELLLPAHDFRSQNKFCKLHSPGRNAAASFKAVEFYLILKTRSPDTPVTLKSSH